MDAGSAHDALQDYLFPPSSPAIADGSLPLSQRGRPAATDESSDRMDVSGQPRVLLKLCSFSRRL